MTADFLRLQKSKDLTLLFCNFYYNINNGVETVNFSLLAWEFNK